ncbi:hypothetical protein P7228_05310 [Altererythrobacter arenosus]|uniref:DUF308 domain-containing protein n=1 Tax=Altererythrobacter arenosus TaxID=3032592 RepID=A0ABY8FWP0_9SPHN|nr:hypothetical protein [Altererythrobacter sp. CAU 1644]WFL78485.1 hypothetical protein P7228_05310 [Altererythrobacter sp. CAU 1644]
MALGRRTTATPRQPLAAHPAFAAILCLWVAALFGLAVMVLPGAMLEGLVARSGLAAVLPAAEPPLGSTARFLVAAAAAVFGGVAGFMIARLLARLTARKARVAVENVADPEIEDPVFAPEIDSEEEDPFPFDIDPDMLDDEIEEPAIAEISVEPSEPAILTIEELDQAGLDRAVAKDEAQDWDFEQASHDPEDFRPDVGAWGLEEEVEDFEPTPEPAPLAHAPSPHSVAPQAPAPDARDGLGRLRSRRLEELSLAEMVERFGGALSEHRDAIERDPALRNEVQPVIAAALKALTGHERAKRAAPTQYQATQGNAALDISTREQAEATEEALREALEKLQRMSGNF